MKKTTERKMLTSFRMSATAYNLLQRLVAHTGIGRGAVLELAIREFARAQGVK